MSEITIQEGEGLTFEQLKDVISKLPNAPKLTDLKFVENIYMPDNTIMVSPKIMKLLNDIFNTQTSIK